MIIFCTSNYWVTKNILENKIWTRSLTFLASQIDTPVFLDLFSLMLKSKKIASPSPSRDERVEIHRVCGDFYQFWNMPVLRLNIGTEDSPMKLLRTLSSLPVPKAKRLEYSLWQAGRKASTVASGSNMGRQLSSLSSEHNLTGLIVAPSACYITDAGKYRLEVGRKSLRSTRDTICCQDRES